jgi:hypothetical protein
LVFVGHHPALEQRAKDKVARLQGKLAAALPLPLFKAAQKKGKSLRMDEVVNSLS